MSDAGTTSRAEWVKVLGSSLVFAAIGFAMGLYLVLAWGGVDAPSVLYPLATLTLSGLGAGLGAGLAAAVDAPFGWSIVTTVVGAAAGLAAGLLGAGLEVTVLLAALIWVGTSVVAVNRG